MAKNLREEYPRVWQSKEHGRTRYVVDCRRKGWIGKGRLSFTTRDEAIARARVIAAQLESAGMNGTNAFSTVVTNRVLKQWVDQLKTRGKTLEDAVGHYVRWLDDEERKKTIPMLSELFVRWREAKEADKTKLMRHRSLNDIRARSNQFARDWGHLRADELDRAKVEKFLNEMQTADGHEVAAQSRKNYRGKLSEFLNWAVAQGILPTNPIASLKVHVPYKIPEVFSIEDCATILRVVQQSEHLPMRSWIVLGLFAGMRPEEAQRLTWGHVTNGHILVDPENTKVKRARSVQVSLPLEKWLEVADKSLPLIPNNFIRRLAKLIQNLSNDGVQWIQDGLRHSYATYWLKLNNNHPLLGELMGNTPQILGKHYIRPVSQQDAVAYFQFTPKTIDTHTG